MTTLFDFLFQKPDTSYGSASFMDISERRLFLNSSKKGICLDGRNKLSPEDSFKHSIVLASTGLGKTSGFVLPNILRFSSGSFVCTDPSGEIMEQTKGWITEGLGMDIKVFNLENIEESLHFNCLERVQTDYQAQKLASILIEAGGQQPSGGDRFWADSARSAVQMVILALINPNQFEFDKNLTSLFIILNKGFEDDDIARFMIHNLEDSSRLQFMAFMKQESKVRASVMSTAKVAISVMASKELQKVTADETLNFEEIRQKPTAIFLIVREDEWKHLSFLTSILLQQLLKFCMEAKKEGNNYLPIYFFLDEVGHLKIPDLGTLVTTLRRRSCSLNLILQDYQQLDHYGSDKDTILNNCVTKIYFPGLPINICQSVEKMMGRETISLENRMLGKPLMTADEIRTMPMGTVICIHGNRKPLKLKMKPWYKQRLLRNRSK